jgi:dihydropteroate synthase
MDRLHELGRPLLLALSRKDFIGAITGRPPRERLAGTLAAVGGGWRAGGHLFRVHDVAAAREALTVQRVLDGEIALDPAARLAEGLRREPGEG